MYEKSLKKWSNRSLLSHPGAGALSDYCQPGVRMIYQAAAEHVCEKKLRCPIFYYCTGFVGSNFSDGFSSHVTTFPGFYLLPRWCSFLGQERISSCHSFTTSPGNEYRNSPFFALFVLGVSRSRCNEFPFPSRYKENREGGRRCVGMDGGSEEGRQERGVGFDKFYCTKEDKYAS